MRNKAFDLGLLKEHIFETPIINLGNLSVGGTGKTPHIEYFISLYGKSHTVAVLSRGYGRKTKGFRRVATDDTAMVSGDEPLLIKTKFPQTEVFVCEDRVLGIKNILKDFPQTNLILLDDAFQHRYVKPGLNILLTTYHNPFWKDLVLPAGQLREFRSGWKRSDIVILTKCPEIPKLKIPVPILSRNFFYSRIQYGNIILKSGTLKKNILLLTGIADPDPILKHLNEMELKILKHFSFKDHHKYLPSDLTELLRMSDPASNMILTTEKDWTKLKSIEIPEELNLGVLPIQIQIENEPEDWLNLVYTGVK